MKRHSFWLILGIWCLCGVLFSVGITMLLALLAQGIPTPLLTRAAVHSDAFMLCCGLLLACWLMIGLLRQLHLSHVRENRLQAQLKVRPFMTSSFNCAVEYALNGPNCFYAQVYGSVVSEAAPPERFRSEGLVLAAPIPGCALERYSAAVGKSLIAYQLENLSAAPTVHLSLILNGQRLFQFQALGAGSRLTLYLLFDAQQLLANECLLRFTLRYQDSFSLGAYSQTESATVVHSFGQSPTVAQRMDDLLTPPVACAPSDPHPACFPGFDNLFSTNGNP